VAIRTLASLLLAASLALGCQKPQPKPLTRVQLTSLVKAGIASAQVAMLVHDRGINFEPTDDDLLRLRAAGAGQDVMAALKTATRVKPLEPATVHSQWADSAKGSSPGSGDGAGQRPLRPGPPIKNDNLVFHESAEYPPLARMARIQGVVRMEVLIGKDGSVQDIKVLSGHKLLVMSAVLAVSEWRYQPLLINEKPVEWETEVDVNFQLGE